MYTQKTTSLINWNHAAALQKQNSDRVRLLALLCMAHLKLMKNLAWKTNIPNWALLISLKRTFFWIIYWKKKQWQFAVPINHQSPDFGKRTCFAIFQRYHQQLVLRSIYGNLGMTECVKAQQMRNFALNYCIRKLRSAIMHEINSIGSHRSIKR